MLPAGVLKPIHTARHEAKEKRNGSKCCPRQN